jgi:hypothetical protein
MIISTAFSSFKLDRAKGHLEDITGTMMRNMALSRELTSLFWS